MSGLNEGDEGINDGLRGEEAAVGVLLAYSVVNQDTGTKTPSPLRRGGCSREMPVFTKGSRAATSDRYVLKDGYQFTGL